MIVLKFDPNVKIGTFELSEKSEAQKCSADNLVAMMESCGAIFLGYHLKMSKTIQPRFQLSIPVDEAFDQRLSSRQKKKIKECIQKGILVEKVNSEHLDEFMEVIHCTEKRKGISLRNQEYFFNLLNAYHDHSTVLVAKVNFDLAIKNLQDEYQKRQKQLAELSEQAVKKRRDLSFQQKQIEKEILQIQKDKKELKDTVASAILLVEDGTTAELLYSGYNERYQRYYPAVALRYAGMKWAHQRGCKYFNFGGVQGTFDDGLYEFKSSFHPLIDVYVGEFDLPCMKLMYPLWTYCLPAAKKIIKKLYQMKKNTSYRLQQCSAEKEWMEWIPFN